MSAAEAASANKLMKLGLKGSFLISGFAFLQEKTSLDVCRQARKKGQFTYNYIGLFPHGQLDFGGPQEPAALHKSRLERHALKQKIHGDFQSATLKSAKSLVKQVSRLG
jgi:hypothetical protein